MNNVSDPVCIRLGVPAPLHDQATHLYCEAFRQKLRPFLGPVERASRFLASGLVTDRAFVALHDHEVVGIAGFKLAGTGLFDPSLAQFLGEYKLSAPLRLLGLVLLDRHEEPSCLLMDGIAVRNGERGRGIGTRLLQAIEDHARRLGMTSVRLDVVDTNPGARRLYERFGFRAEGSVTIAPFGALFPFNGFTTMRKRLGRRH